MKALALGLISLIFSTVAFAHPASDRVLDFFQDLDASRDGSPSKICRIIHQSFEHVQIMDRLMGNYVSSPDKAGVADMRRSSATVMATKAIPELKKIAGERGSYSVNPNPTTRGNGYFAVSAKVVGKGKTYNLVFLVSPNQKISDVEYLGFSAINHLGRKFRGDLDELKRQSNTPVTQYMRNLRADSDYVNCN